MKRKTELLWLVVTALWVLTTSSASAQNAQAKEADNDNGVLKVRLLTGEGGDKDKEFFQWKLLELALQKSGVAYDLDISDTVAVPGRLARQMKELGDEGNLIWHAAIKDSESEYRAVKFPIFRGLRSFQYIWVREDDTKRFEHVRTLQDLQEFSMLWGNWPSRTALEAEGFNIVPGTYLAMPRMLANNRADMYMHSAIDTENLLALDALELGLTPLKNAVIFWPAEFYFFMDESSNELHDALSRGMKNAIADGSHEALLLDNPVAREMGCILSDNNLAVLNVTNTLMSKETLDIMDTYGLSIKNADLCK